MKSQYKSCFLVIALLATTAFAQAEKRQQINLHQQEIAEILAAKDTYVYFGPAICSLASDLPALRKMAAAAGVDAQHLNALCEIAAQGYTTAPADMAKAALEEAAACVAACKAELTAAELTRIADALEAYDQAVQSGAADVIVADDENEEDQQTRGTKKFDNVVIRKQASIGSLYVGGDTIINHNLTVNGDELVRGNLTVLGDTIFSDTSVRFAGDQIISGNLKVLENIKLPDANTAGTVGVLQLGVDPIYAFNMGTSNFFAGDYTTGMPATISTGSHNIAIGTRANAGLTTQFQTIAIGNNANATGNAATAVGRNSLASNSVAQAFGSSAMATGSFSLSMGIATIASGTNSVAMGTNATASGESSLALGDGTNATGLNSISIGTGTSSSTNGVAIGEGAIVLGDNGIALGTTATATGNSNAIAIGNGAQALYPNSIAIGTSVVTTASGTYIGGINDAVVAGSAVIVNGANQLGVLVSARRFKENFRNLDNHSAQIYNLNPVKFDYKAEHGGAKDQFGLIADDVAKVLPEIVVHDKDGEIYSVQYHVLPTLLLNEMKHHKNELDALKAEVAMLKAARNAAR